MPLGGPLSPVKRAFEARTKRRVARSAFLALLDHSLRRCIYASALLDASRHHTLGALFGTWTHWSGLCAGVRRRFDRMDRAIEYAANVTARHRYARGMAALLSCAMTNVASITLTRTGRHALLQRSIDRWALGSAHYAARMA